MNNFQQNKYGIRADDKYFQQFSQIEIPKQKGDKIATLNNQGFMRVELDPFSLQWIESATNSDLPFLEIGAAYGQASVEALKGGATIIANDIELDHLRIIRNRVDPTCHNRLFLQRGYFPEEIDLPDSSIGGVLMCRVGHFFTHEKMDASLQAIYKMLAPGGSLFFVSVSPYHYSFRERFLPIYQERRKRGDQNPGYINNMKDYMLTEESAALVPDFLNAWDLDVITPLLEINHFGIIRSELFDYAKNNSNHRGFTGLQAIKVS